jgi:hypothetical protein
MVAAHLPISMSSQIQPHTIHKRKASKLPADRSPKKPAPEPENRPPYTTHSHWTQKAYMVIETNSNQSNKPEDIITHYSVFKHGVPAKPMPRDDHIIWVTPEPSTPINDSNLARVVLTAGVPKAQPQVGNVPPVQKIFIRAGGPQFDRSYIMDCFKECIVENIMAWLDQGSFGMEWSIGEEGTWVASLRRMGGISEEHVWWEVLEVEVTY